MLLHTRSLALAGILFRGCFLSSLKTSRVRFARCSQEGAARGSSGVPLTPASVNFFGVGAELALALSCSLGGQN